MSVAWFTELYRLNEAGRFADALRKSDRYLGQRPRDYALHLQRARALVGLGQLEEAEVHLDAAVTHSEGLAAWPFFYRATLHALAGRRARAKADLARAVTLDPALAEVAARHGALAPLKVRVATGAVGPARPGARRGPPAKGPARAPRAGASRAPRANAARRPGRSLDSSPHQGAPGPRGARTSRR